MLNEQNRDLSRKDNDYNQKNETRLFWESHLLLSFLGEGDYHLSRFQFH